MRMMLALVLVAASLARPADPRQAGDQLALRAVRFYRAEHRHTRVTAFLEIPWDLVRAAAPSPNDSAGPSYHVTFRLADSSGATLHTQTWTAVFPEAQRQHGACAVETVEFRVPPGRFRLEATVRNPAGGHEAHAALDLDGFADPPAVSDLLLSPAIRRVAVGDSVPQPGELRRGGALVTAAALPRLSSARTTAHYLLEAYAGDDHEETGTMTVAVKDAGGGIRLRWRPLPVRVQPGGNTLHGHVSLAGLKPGRYSLVVSVALAGRVEERGAEFVMGP